MTSVRSGPDALPVPEQSPLKGATQRSDSQAREGGAAKSASPNVNSPGAGASNLEARRAEAEEDRALIESAQSGDSRAFRKLVERHQRRAFAIAFAMVRDENDAKDLVRSEEHTSELQSQSNLVCRLLLEKKKKKKKK